MLTIPQVRDRIMGGSEDITDAVQGYLTVPQAATILGVSKPASYEAIREDREGTGLLGWIGRR